MANVEVLIGRSFKGSEPLGMGFVLGVEEAQALLNKDPCNKDVRFPYLNGEDLNSRPDQSPSRWTINFHDWPLGLASVYTDCFSILYEKVRPERKLNSIKILQDKWWVYKRTSPALYSTISNMKRVLVRAQVSRIHAPIFFEPGLSFP